MKTIVISFSLTGNNETLAKSISSLLCSDHIRITEPKQRTYFAIGLDMLFNRTPKVIPTSETIEEYDHIVFVGPVWMGQIATPFRAYFKKYKHKIKRYSFVSISGGADGPNIKLSRELKKRLGMEPSAVINILIADLLSGYPAPTREVTESYRLKEKDARIMTYKIITDLV